MTVSTMPRDGAGHRAGSGSSLHAHSDRSSLEKKPAIWWSNGIFFIGFHLMALYGALYLSPPSKVPWQTWILCFISWQLASFGITIGYHRLWSHQAFTATLPLRCVLAWMGCLGFQGSIKWWVLRHRLHHRFTDSPVHDPYSASKGLWYSHAGWIFFRPKYQRMKYIEREDLESDPVVRFQHKHFVILAISSGLVLPTLVGKFGWGDAMGGYVWGGLVARLLIWHTTFCINSLAHWHGLQPYSEEMTARGNYKGLPKRSMPVVSPPQFYIGLDGQLVMLTLPVSFSDWDPTKWIIYFLHHYTPLIPSVATTPEAEVLKARARVLESQAFRLKSQVPEEFIPKPESELPVWSAERALQTASGLKGEGSERTLLLVDRYFVDVTEYLDQHPGGSTLLRNYSINASRPNVSKRQFGSGSQDRSASKQRGDSPTDSGYESGSLPSSPRHASQELFAEEKAPNETDSTTEIQPELSNTPKQKLSPTLKDATHAFFGQINNHSIAAREKMRCLRVARLVDPEDRLGAVATQHSS